MVTEKYLERVKDLPIMPEVAAKVLNLSEGKLEISSRELEDIIRVDPSLTAKILKIANSALYARPREIKSLAMAITLLGFKNIKNLVLLVTASNVFPGMRKTSLHATFWRHSILTAFLARNLSVRCGRNDFAEDAFIAGLLHDIGQPALFSFSPDEYAQALEAEKLGAMLLETIEEQMFGTNHREVGGALLKKWNFPGIYEDTAREHDTLNITSSFKPLIIHVSTAGLIADAIGGGGLSSPREEILQQFLPYTCLGAADVSSLAAQFSAEVAGDRLFKEFQGLLGIG